ncbi:MAG: metallopeptidase family protein, partial [Gaiellales bacterium]
MESDIFEQTIAAALDELPAQFRALLENVEILIVDEWPDDPGLYGLYDGIPLTERGTGSEDLRGPDRVYVFRRPLTEDFGADQERLAGEIRITVLHEFAHYFGIGEGRLA